jgi:O-acetyl-ADP-ribose deacetylase (regulator of RNase III)
MTIRYEVGDATRPLGIGPKVVVHCVNDIGKWGSGFVLAIDARWPGVAPRYRQWSRSQSAPDDPPFHLGAVQFVQVEPDLWVANMVGQHRTIADGEKTPIRYDAFTMGFRTVAAFCREHLASVHAPRLGAGLARGDWTKIAALLSRELVDRGVPVTVYQLAT